MILIPPSTCIPTPNIKLWKITNLGMKNYNSPSVLNCCGFVKMIPQQILLSTLSILLQDTNDRTDAAL